MASVSAVQDGDGAELQTQLNNVKVSDEAVDMEVRQAGIESLKDMLLESLISDANVVIKSQQRGDPDLNHEEQLSILSTLFEKSPCQFVTSYGKFIKSLDLLKCFDNHRKKDPLLEVQLIEIENRINEGQRVIKRRRYEALQRLVDTTDYFTEEIMQRRNPILYDQLIGRFHTKAEREAFLQLSNRSKNCSDYGGPLVDLFMAHMNRNADGSSVRRECQESQQQAEDEADEEYFDEEMDEDDSDYFSGNRETSSRKWNSPQEQEGCEEIEDEEKDLFKEEFFTTMYRSFLEGKDIDFDYTTVDDNSDYDCGETCTQDIEDKYFDEEEPCTSPQLSQESDDDFKYPKRLTGIESSLGKCGLKSDKASLSCASNNTVTIQDDSEDELDIYMKSIETQVTNS